MKIIESWLREWINPPLTINEIAEQLTTAGLEVAAVSSSAAEFSGVVVGEIVAIAPHPDADKLRLCQVKVDSTAQQQSLLTIVCGASNARCGLKAPVALIDAVLPGNIKIKKTKLRGIDSYGMLCSAKELQLTAPADAPPGLLELPSDAPVGMDMRDYLKLNDSVIDIELTANRGDCLSVLGVAREVAALNRMPLGKLNNAKVQLKNAAVCQGAAEPTITLAAPAACPHYAACVIDGVNNRVATPAWLKERLEKSGLRSVNPIVDVTNYVMLELGQPLHAFDYTKVHGGNITVRYANMTGNAEKIVLLDGKELQLTHPNTLVIADDEQAIAVAGVMGGLNSAVDGDTSKIVLESAYFDPEIVRKTARYYGLQSDAAYRFERGVDPGLQERAIARASQLLQEIVGGVVSSTVMVQSQAHLPTAKIIFLPFARVNALLGAELTAETITAILALLGMDLEVVKNEKGEHCGVNVTAPTYRFDISIAEDLIEEIARIYGYDKLPATPIHGAFAVRTREERETISEREIKQFLVAQGYSEAITYSFVSPKLQALLDPKCVPIELVNPISPEMSVMRTTLWGGLVNALLHNLKRQHDRIRLFETGLCFCRDADGKVEQRRKVAGIVAGEVLAEQWKGEKSKFDFYDVKNDVENLLYALHCVDRRNLSVDFCNNGESHHLALHPKRSAAVNLNKKMLGYIGELHPKVRQMLEIKPLVYLFELDVQSLPVKVAPLFKPISKFPTVERDVAFVLDKEVSWQNVKEQVQGCGGELLQEVKIFDLYQGGVVEETKKSIALRLCFQHASHTLTDAEVEKVLGKIIITLARNLNATLRG